MAKTIVVRMIEIQRVAEVDEAAVLPQRHRRLRRGHVLSVSVIEQATTEDQGGKSRMRVRKHKVGGPRPIYRDLFGWKLPVQCQVQLEHVDARFAKQTQVGIFGELGNQLMDLFNRYAADFVDTRSVRSRRIGAQVRIQAAASSRNLISWEPTSA